MRGSVETMENKLPMELQLDLLVDGELSEEQRRALLLRLNDEPPGPWRELAVRFLQRQTEKESVRQLMAGGSVVPAKLLVEPLPASPVVGRLGRQLSWTMATAAALLLVATSAMATFYLTQPSGTSVAAQFEASIPGEAVSYDRNVPVTVRVMKGNRDIFYNQIDPRMSRQSLVIQPDGRGNAIVIPVNTMKAATY